jgi:uncharacterized protein
LLILFFASLIRSAFGFGEALIAVPLLALFVPLTLAAPLAVLVSITIASIVVIQDRKEIHLRSAIWLVLATVPGIPLGLMLLKSSHQAALKASLAVLIIVFSGYSLLGWKRIELRKDSRVWMFLCGVAAGVLGGAYGMNGPPLAIYGAMRGWSAQRFRATLQAYFLPASLLGMAGYLLAGLWTATVTHYYLLSLPLTVAAVFLGRAINHRLHGNSFHKLVYLGLGIIGLILLVETKTAGP